MRYALYRLTAPILDRIPDISHQPKGRQMSIGLAASLLFHLLLLLLALLFSLILPQHSLVDFAKAKPKLQEIELTIVPPAVVELPKVVTPDELERMKRFLDSDGLAKADAAPDKPVFESDANMKAASEKAGTGDLPLPSQSGRTDRGGPQFTDQKSMTGSIDPPAPPQPTATAPAPEAPTAQTPEPKPAETEKAPPSPLKEVDATSPDEIALTKKAAEPAPPLPPKIKMRTTAPLAMLTTPAPVRPHQTYQPMQEKTEIDGNITNTGKNSVDAEGTPMGRYKKGIKVAAGSRWNYYVTGNGGTVKYPPGSVLIRFHVNRKGKISDIKVLDNTSTGSYALACEKAVRDTKLPPPPKNLFDPLPNHEIEITFRFTLYQF